MSRVSNDLWLKANSSRWKPGWGGISGFWAERCDNLLRFRYSEYSCGYGNLPYDVVVDRVAENASSLPEVSGKEPYELVQGAR